MSDPTNLEIAAALDELGDLYELDGAIIHRVVAYRNGAKAVRDASASVAALARAGRATELPGIGETLQAKLRDLVETGDIPAAVKLRAKFPPGLVAMTRIPGLGPKRARVLHAELGIDSPEALQAAAERQEIRGLKGFGPKAEENILAGLAQLAAAGGAGQARVLLDRALAVGEPIVAALRAHPAAERVELAGSARRMADTVKDLDVIATASDPAALIAALAEIEEIDTVTSSGEAGARARTHAGLGVDLRVVAPEQFGSLLQHFTGSKEHNMALREAAVRRGLHVSEYGILDDADGQTHPCATEEEVYERLGYDWIEPELRENRGELEAAAAGGASLPALVTLADIRGDLHAHTVASDGHATIEEMARAAAARGYEYLAITDHSASHGFGDDVSPAQLRRQIGKVRKADAAIGGIRILAGTEVNILPDGSLDYDDALLAQLDWVVASVHTSFRMGSDAMTERMIAAIGHPGVDAIGHPTGRMLGKRPGYAVDLEAVIAAAAQAGTMLEINANPNRRDLDDVHARAAAAAGVPIVIDSDAHRTETLAVMRFGVATARRAWLGPGEVANTRSWADLQALRKPGRRRDA
ncbi:MAG: DNA polymerase/3'-5' exonuclease PolX [Solirubrobacteraceae bacterium]